MERSTKIGLIVGAVVLVGAGVGYYFYQRKKKNGTGMGTEKGVVSGENLAKKSASLKSSTSNPYANTPEITTLNTEIAKVYYAMEILENRGGVIYNTKTGSPVAEGLDKATWIQLQKKTGMIQNDFSRNRKVSQVMSHGNKLISTLRADIDKMFPPAKYNVNTDWYIAQA
jgi:hypothetical protein